MLPAVFAYFTCFSALQRAENSSIMGRASTRIRLMASFSALQRAENSSINAAASMSSANTRSFSALQRAENSSIDLSCVVAFCASVSVLFSEPKIPQWRGFACRIRIFHVFQCSSASRKFLNAQGRNGRHRLRGSFSALQRAENSSMTDVCGSCRRGVLFQCSSASRKFLNIMPYNCIR